MNLIKLKNDIDFAIKNKYSIKVYYTDNKNINYNDSTINWLYPPYIVKNYVPEKIILEIESYFKNYNDLLIVMYFENDDIIHKIPLNLPT
jgi:hypothetical protein|tara:strand:+ start:165 stop:434 length:270 start_codon:yes stop_codon:yes gene_type:complete